LYSQQQKYTMLQRLSINNYALIQQLELPFGKGLNIITGETGSGKSIMIEALELILGERADSKSLFDKEKKCVIEGEFNLKGYELENFFSENEIEFDEITILRREISVQGKSRAFINDTPVTLQQLKELGVSLVDIHSQHQTLEINKSVNRFDLLDTFADAKTELKKYQESFAEYKSISSQLEELLETEKKSKLDLDYFQFQYTELEEAKLKEGEEESVEKELELLTNSEEIKTGFQKAISILDDQQSGVVNNLKEVKSILQKLSKFSSETEKLSERVESSLIEVKDILSEIEILDGKVFHDQKRIELLSERLNLINNLLFKHRVKTSLELISLRDELGNKISSITSLDETIEKLTNEKDLAFKKVIESGNKLREKRKSVCVKLEKEIKSILADLAMPHAEMKIQLSEAGEPLQNGLDHIEFLFQANKGGELREISKVASGGEFSRLMLAIKSITSKLKSLPTIIFDEIDTGVSGDVANKMGDIMRGMGKSMQVFSITHLPQVAVKGNSQYKVFKTVSKNITSTQVKKLTEHERIEEIAKMLSGDKLSEAALANAKELLGAK
jgi:DNA repair protein RecN (Recombination protein N)